MATPLAGHELPDGGSYGAWSVAAESQPEVGPKPAFRAVGTRGRPRVMGRASVVETAVPIANSVGPIWVVDLRQIAAR